MKIGNLELDGNVLLAPMAGYNDAAFRLMCQKYGSALNFSAMISAEAVTRKSERTLTLAATPENEKYLAIQLFGSDVTVIKRAIGILENDYPETIRPNMFDFNLGCPVRKVTNKGAGSALLAHPKKIGEIISGMRNSTDLPVSAKMRLGLNAGSGDHVKIARIIEESGADMLAVHGRYQDQRFSGAVHLEKIREIKENLDIPVVGNGDVRDESSAELMMKETKCDCIMVGRASAGNPFIFRRIDQYLKNGRTIPQIDPRKLFREYYELAKEYSISPGVIKKHAVQFIRGIPCSAKIRKKIMEQNDAERIREIIIEE